LSRPKEGGDITAVVHLDDGVDRADELVGFGSEGCDRYDDRRTIILGELGFGLLQDLDEVVDSLFQAREPRVHGVDRRFLDVFMSASFSE
jgi:hypothetical protein